MNFSTIGVIAKDDCAEALSTIQSVFTDASITRIDPKKDTDLQPDLIITLGGDGTLLSAIDSFPTTPILGINYGTVGFLTAAQDEDLESTCIRIRDGDFVMEERPLIELSHRDNTYYAFNEVVIKGITKVVELELKIDGFVMNTVKGDGIIVGTSSGSTAYLLSTGGPIVTPTVDCFIITGLNEYSLIRNPIVVDCKRHIDVRLSAPTRNSHIYLVYDGKPEIVMEEGEAISIKRAPFSAKLIYLDKNHFFQSLQRKLKYGQCHPG